LDGTISATKLNSHADSPIVGKYAKVLELTGKTVKVSGFTSDLGKAIKVPIVNVTVAYDCEYTCKTHILVIYNTLYLRNMEVNLVPPMMMRLAGLQVNECPKFLSKTPSIEDHSVYFPSADVKFPFHIYGVVSYLPTRLPTESELRDLAREYLLLTPNTSVWDPHTEIYRDQESEMLDY
jgi:hypothetical protein